ncbi:MAG: CHAT domain-containing protein [Oscillatoriales cyanobacterium]|nr:MAG: CHAT domain-containing protein [Oscillatoriales cyanobacterium]
MVAWRRTLATIMAIGLTAASGGAAQGRSPQGLPPGAIAQTTTDPDGLIQRANELFYRQDQYAEAARLYQQAIANGGQNRLDAIGPLAQCLMLLGKDTEAIPLLKRFANGEVGNETWLSRLALAEYRTGQYASAEQHLLRVIASWEARRSNPELTDIQRVTLLEQQSYAYRQLLRTLITQGKTDAALEWAERGRSRSLVEVLMQQATRQQAATPLSVAQIRQVAKQLNATIVTYSVLSKTPKIIGDEFEDDPTVAIWAVQPSGAIAFKQVEASAVAGQSITEIVLAARSAMTSATALVNPTTELKRLYQLLIAPIAPQLPRDPQQRVIFVTQGAINLVPLAALQAPNGDYLIQRHTIATAPSIQVLALAEQRRQTQAVATGPGLVVGNPVLMPEIPNGPSGHRERLSPLPGAETEAQAIAQLLGVRPLLTDAATKPAILSQITNQRILHFATHGVLDLDANLNEFGRPRDPNAPKARQGGVIVTPGSVIIGGNVTVNGRNANLALAGEGVVQPAMPGLLALAPTRGDDGLLRAADIATMRLSAQLVVLSACNTGRGRITGDGVMGLARSFLVAGVPTVVASLWKVPDEATKTLMVAFYQALPTQRDRASALRQAMLETLKTHPNPRDWSAFITIGAP